MRKDSLRIRLVFFNACVIRKSKLVQYRKFLADRGHVVVEDQDQADLTLVWTCGFRTDIRDGCLRALGRILDTAQGDVLLTGCLPDICPEMLPSRPGSRVMRWRDDAAVLEDILGPGPSLDTYDPVFVEERRCVDTAASRRENPEADYTFHDQFIKLGISEGCRFNCAYCSEKLAFPEFRSFPKEKIVQAARDIVARTQVYDIVLIADSLGQYGLDTGETFPGLLEAICAIDPRVGLALNNLNPANLVEYLDDIAELIRNDRIRHLNLPIQSASDNVLSAMRRTYRQNDLHDIYSRLRDLDFTAHDTHLIVGFPGESDEDFHDTLQFLLEYKPRFVLLSKYMEALAAPSARLPNKVPPATVQKRIKAAEDIFTEAGIIFNSDDSELSKFRVEALFHTKTKG